MFTLNNISKSFGDKTLFENVNLQVYPGERIGIVGSNGTGKSTLIKIMAGVIEPDTGKVSCEEKICYLSQGLGEENFQTNFASVDEFKVFAKNANALNLEKILNQPNLKFKNFSGGEKTKFVISKLWAQNPEVLLLDEPTNHLDVSTTNWLVQQIDAFKGTVIIVSHNRDFLNKTVHKIIELENGKLTQYYGNYADYAVQKKEKIAYINSQREKQIAKVQKAQKAIQKLSALTQKLEKSTHRDGSSDARAKGYKDSAQRKVKKVAKMAEAKRAKLEKLIDNQIEKPFQEKSIYYRIESQNLPSKLLIRAKDLGKDFGKIILFKNADFTVEQGQKIALCGDNGAGKTTLIKILLDEEGFSGNLFKSQALKMAYLPQEDLDLQTNQTIFEFAEKFDGFYKTKFLTNLVGFGFSREMFSHKISTLSFGERMKIKLNELILSDFNMLILDEPTNHLDVQNRIFLEGVLQNYSGSLIIVSHDEQFINNVCNKKLVIKNNMIFEE